MIETRNKLKGRKNLLTVAVAGVAAATAFAATPASAAFFSWCGIFPDGGKIDGIIQVDDVTGVFIKLLGNVTTETAAFINPITYTTANYITPLPPPPPPVLPAPPVLVVAADDDNPFQVFRYKFIQGPNELQVNIPSSWFPNKFPAIGDPPILIGNREIRNDIPRKDPDDLRQVSVPGPLPILGAAAAFGFSRNIRKRIKSANS